MNSRELLKLLSFDADELEAKDEAAALLAELEQLSETAGESSTYKEKDKHFTEILQEVSASLIFKLVEINPELTSKPEYQKEIEFKNKFRIYCEKHPTLWKSFLVPKGYHGDKLNSLDQNESCSTLKQYLGQFLLSEWRKNSDLAILDKACEMNIFPALAERCDRNLTLLKSGQMSAEQALAIEKQIFADITHITNQYWSPGYLYSYTVFINLAELHHLNLIAHNADEIPMDNYYLLCALECELIAAKLIKHPMSQKIFMEHNIKDWLPKKISHNTESDIEKALTKAEKDILAALDINKTSKIYSDVKNTVEEKHNSFKLS